MMHKVGENSKESGCKVVKIVDKFLNFHFWIANWWYDCVMVGLGSWQTQFNHGHDEIFGKLQLLI